jgi:hypothetical protein
MKTPLKTRGSRANDGRSARLGKKQPDGTHADRIAHLPGVRLRPLRAHPAGPGQERASTGMGAARQEQEYTPR